MQTTLHKDFCILNYILRNQNQNAIQYGSRPNRVPETGLEPVRGCPQRFLSRQKGYPKPSVRVHDRILITNSNP